MSEKRRLSRRRFIETTTAAGALGVAAPYIVSAEALGRQGKPGANERIQLGLIGAGGMGRGNLANCARHDDVAVTAICEVQKDRLDATVDKYKAGAKGFLDYRELLARKDVDAVIIASPPHWHALMAIDACAAGKDIYLQKPMTLHFGESIAVRNAVRKHNRISQVGTQIHSSANYGQVVEIVRSGQLGKISVARTFNNCNIGPEGIGNDPNCEPPKTVDWNWWVGPGPMRPFNPLIVKNSFTHSSFIEYSGGWTPCWAPHIIDLPVWALKLGIPSMVSSSGGRYALQDAGDVHDVQETVCQYPGFTLTWMMSMVNSYGFDFQGKPGTKRRLGTYFHGVNGTLFANYGTHDVVPEGDRMQDMEPASPPRENGVHERNWLDAIKSRKQTVCPVAYHHHVNAPIVLGNLSLKLGRSIQLDPETEKIIGDAEAAKAAVPEYRTPWKFPTEYL